MKIINKKPKTPQIKVSDIPQGGCFLYKYKMYMKLDSYLQLSKSFISIYSEAFFKDKSFILNLSDTETDSQKIDIIKSDTLVEPIDAELQIVR